MVYRAALTRGFPREPMKQPDDLRERALRAMDEMIADPFLGVRLRG